MLLSPCIEWIFKAEHENFCDRIWAASAAGFKAVEFHMWRNKPLDEVERALAETGLLLTSCLVEPRVMLTDPAAEEATLTAVRESLPVAKRLKARALVVASGPIVQGRERAAQHAAMVSVLKNAARLAEDAGVSLLLEPVNTTVDHPGVFLDLTPEGLDIIEEVGSPRLRLLYDMYHSTCMGESPEVVLGNRMNLVAHVQVADAPGRNEPGSGAIDWPAYLAVLQSKGYRGAIGLEYRPTADSLASLQRTRRSFGLD
jgi:hydroxypyruvate isomerase